MALVTTSVEALVTKIISPTKLEVRLYSSGVKHVVEVAGAPRYKRFSKVQVLYNYHTMEVTLVCERLQAPEKDILEKPEVCACPEYFCKPETLVPSSKFDEEYESSLDIFMDSPEGDLEEETLSEPLQFHMGNMRALLTDE